ncbi:hypothetical protein SAMN02745674_01404 [Lysobacter spongiicola DSM 21749]|uniref:Uncharacterized protein n=1 Tax=Lysobacter spongiicola DSM 21749 TaxID=1122188 RepID=A0A1T4PZ63_9GAMM|nr:hypothetical protein SAMN02745674_01404 [Lysobacter spongiicola DSM 21749]
MPPKQARRRTGGWSWCGYRPQPPCLTPQLATRRQQVTCSACSSPLWYCPPPLTSILEPAMKRRQTPAFELSFCAFIALAVVGCSGSENSGSRSDTEVSSAAGPATPVASAQAVTAARSESDAGELAGTEMLQVALGMSLMAEKCGTASSSELQAELAEARIRFVADGGNAGSFERAADAAKVQVDSLSPTEVAESCAALEQAPDRWSR